MVGAKQAERLPPIPEVFASNPVIGKIFYTLCLLLSVEKTKITKKRPAMDNLK